MDFKEEMTTNNVVYEMGVIFPALLESIEEFKKSDDISLLHNFFAEIFNPFFHTILNSPQTDKANLKRVFYFLEKMARSADFDMRNILGVTILEKLNSKQLKTAEKYMGPSTKKNLHDLEKYLEQLFADHKK